MSKSLLRIALAVAMLFTLFVAPGAKAQDESPTIYVQVDYMKVASGSEAEYIDVEGSIWKPIHEARLGAGTLVSWSLYAILYPSGTNAEYNYVTVNVYSDFNHTENTFSDEMVQQAHPEASDTDINDMMARTGASRDLVRSELWMAHDLLQPSNPAKYASVTQMTVPSGGDSAYLQLEKEIWKPIHASSIEAGIRSGWGVYSMMFPNGTSEPYNYGTVNFYDDYSHIVADFSEQVLTASHPDYTDEMWDVAFERTGKVRSVYRSQLWQLIDTTDSEDAGN